MRRLSLVLVTSIAFASCKPDFDDRESLVTTTRVLAIRGEPPEAKPGESVTYSLLVASPDGSTSTPRASWAYCDTPKLLTENGGVSAACRASTVRPIVDGPLTIAATMPDDACFRFGPEVSSAELRPRDPDVTGGFFQPLRAIVQGAETAAFGFERIGCKLSNASADVVTEFARRYQPNRNPTLLPLEVPNPIAPGARVTLRARWTDDSAESYVVLDAVSQALVDRRESIRVSWFATAGSFTSDRTGRTEIEPDTFTDNEWTAPSEARSTDIFVVLRDSRGGTTFATQPLVVR